MDIGTLNIIMQRKGEIIMKNKKITSLSVSSPSSFASWQDVVPEIIITIWAMTLLLEKQRITQQIQPHPMTQIEIMKRIWTMEVL